MNNIKIMGFARKKYKLIAQNVATQIIDSLKLPYVLEVVITFVSKNEIKRLNLENRGIGKATDVLSFPSTNQIAGEKIKIDPAEMMILKTEEGLVHFGDMAICLPICKKQAKEYKVSVESEIKKLVIHSMLHLMGYDHIKDEDYVVMNKKEQQLDKKIKV